MLKFVTKVGKLRYMPQLMFFIIVSGFIAIMQLSVQISFSHEKFDKLTKTTDMESLTTYSDWTSPVPEPGMLYPAFSHGFCPSRSSPCLFDRINLLYCGIQKAGHTQFHALFARAELTSKEEDQATIAKNPLAVYTSSTVGLEKKFLSCDPNNATFEEIITNRKIKKVAVIRDPLDRFISGFIDIVVRYCKECDIGELLRDFLDEIYEIMLEYWFSQRVPLSNENRVNHFWPQYWMCDFQTHIKLYDIIKYNKSEEFKLHARESAIKWGIPPHYVWNGWGSERNQSFLSNPTEHSSWPEQAETVRLTLVGDLQMLDTFLKIYSIDYHQFEFDLPEEAANLCETWLNTNNTICDYKSAILNT